MPTSGAMRSTGYRPSVFESRRTTLIGRGGSALAVGTATPVVVAIVLREVADVADSLEEAA